MDILHLNYLKDLVLLAGTPSVTRTDDKQLADIMDSLIYKLQQAEGHYFDPIYVTPKQARCLKHCYDLNYLYQVVQMLICIEEQYSIKCEKGDRGCICDEYTEKSACRHLCPCNSYEFRCDQALEAIQEATEHAITSIAKDKGLI
jgi:hypothetical protein